MYFMGIDIGTTAVKVIIIDNYGNDMVKSNVEYSLLFPKEKFVEQDPQELWQAVKKAVREAVQNFSGNPQTIRSISLSTQRDTLICVDEENRPLRNAITWMDSRSVRQCERLKKEIGEDYIYRTTGVGISTIWTLSFILWLREQEPEVYQKTSCFALVHDFIFCHLGAKKHWLDYSNCCQTMLFDCRNKVWDPLLMRYAGLHEGLLPELAESGVEIGFLSEALAAEFGMSPLTRLIAGGGDQQVASFGAGCIEENEIEIGIGTAANLLVTMYQFRQDPMHRLVTHCGVLPGQWILEGAMLSAGKVVEWLRETIYSGSSLAEIDCDVRQNSSPGAQGLVIIPHFEGAACPHWNAYTRGTVAGLSLSTTKADIARAVLEGLCMEIRNNLVLLQELGIQAKKITVSGGASRSSVWMQMLADITGVAVMTLQQNDCAAYGAALLAAAGVGEHEVYARAKESISVKNHYIPNDSLCKLYQGVYQKQMKLYEALDQERYYLN